MKRPRGGRGLGPGPAGAAPLLRLSPPRLCGSSIPGLGLAPLPPPKSIPRTRWARFLRIVLSGPLACSPPPFLF